ncbi:hypothetical protein [Aliikangiella sp. IMCC44359]|uniref:hypothetical protein n=1 Tax=Aliikangiella sp. IMCC44359 TaxID=3459125 RepID=UPI00403AD157
MKKMLIVLIVLLSSNYVYSKAKKAIDAEVDKSYVPKIKFKQSKNNKTILVDRFHNTIYKQETGSIGADTLLYLAGKDGFTVKYLEQAFNSNNLKGDILFLHGLPHQEMKTTNGSTYFVSPLSNTELTALIEWISSGGGLYLSLSHHPNGSGAKPLLNALDVNFRDGYIFHPSQPSFISEEDRCSHFFEVSQQNNMLNMSHPIFSMGEEIKNIHYLCGAAIFRNPEDNIIQFPKGTQNFNRNDILLESSDIYAGMIGFNFGKGKVVITGDQGMFRDFIFTFDTKEKVHVTITSPDNDNDKLFINMIRWLGNTRLEKESVD